MIPSVSSADPSRTLVAPVSFSCDCLYERVAAVWNAFLTLLCDCIAWVTSSGSSEKERTLSALLEKYESFADTTNIKNWSGTVVIGRNPIRMSGNTLPFAVKIEKIKKSIEDDHLLFLVANPFYTTEEANRTKLLLELGANPNQAGTSEGHTPLLCAVMTGSFLAYRTLREFGALPVVQIWDRNNPGHRIEMSYLAKIVRVMAAEDPSWTIADYFSTLVPLEENQPSEFKELFPCELIQEHPKYLGAPAEHQKMVDFENARMERVVQDITTLWQYPPALANLIATYNEYY